MSNVSMEKNSTLVTEEEPQIGFQWVPLDTFIGLILAFSSCFFIGVSVIYKKLALKDLEVLYMSSLQSLD